MMINEASMQSFIGIPFALRDGKMFIVIIIEIGAAAHGCRGISLSPTDDVKKAMKFKSKFNPSFMLNGRTQTGLVRVNNVRQKPCRDSSQIRCSIQVIVD